MKINVSRERITTKGLQKIDRAPTPAGKSERGGGPGTMGPTKIQQNVDRDKSKLEITTLWTIKKLHYDTDVQKIGYCVKVKNSSAYGNSKDQLRGYLEITIEFLDQKIIEFGGIISDTHVEFPTEEKAILAKEYFETIEIANKLRGAI